MFLLRGAVVLAVGIMLLPTDEAKQAKVVGTAGAAVERASTFCERNGHTCAAGAEIWATFLKKAEFGARLTGTMIQEWMRSDGDHSSVDRRSSISPQNVLDQSRGTLKPRDLGPNWRGPKTGA